jgi:glycosyltransferase involved in cell wall biosynthesis
MVLLGSRLIKMGIEFSIVALRDTDPDLTDLAEEGGVPVCLLPSRSFTAQVLELRNIVRSLRPQIVHTGLFRADQVGRLACAFTGAKVVSSLVNTPYVEERLTDPNVTRWKLRAAQMVDATTSRLLVDQLHAVSEGVRLENARALHLPLSRITVAERGRDTSSLGERTPERNRRVRTAFGIDESLPLILNIGRQEFQKGQIDLISASRQLAKDGYGHEVLIAGKPGNASDHLEAALSDDSDAWPRVRLLGQREDIGDLLAVADVLVISSRFEGTAGAALEAMAVGTPIVCTDVIGIQGVLEHERNALLVPVGRPSEIANAVTRLIEDSALAARLVQCGQRDFAERFTLDRASESMLRLYQSVMAENG